MVVVSRWMFLVSALPNEQLRDDGASQESDANAGEDGGHQLRSGRTKTYYELELHTGLDNEDGRLALRRETLQSALYEDLSL